VAQNSDRELVILLQQGDLEALGALYDKHHPLVFRTIRGITNDVETAADVTQDVFLRLYRFADRVDPSRPLEPWLYRVAVNQANSWLRRRSRWLRVLEEMAGWLSIGGKPTPESQAEHEDEWRWVGRAVARLPATQRAVVVLYYVNDLSVREIAEILSIPEGTVKSRLHYGRISLKKELGLTDERPVGVQYEAT
jgi:RNA polymerase sigma-70 factor (ECF subfamily)